VGGEAAEEGDGAVGHFRIATEAFACFSYGVFWGLGISVWELDLGVTAVDAWSCESTFHLKVNCDLESSSLKASYYTPYFQKYHLQIPSSSTGCPQVQRIPSLCPPFTELHWSRLPEPQSFHRSVLAPT
jgi:hypothetical protein